MKKILVVLAILFIGILLAGCTSQPAAPVATPAPTMAPTAVVTVAPTAVPTEIVVVEKTANVTAKPTPTPKPQPSVTITFTVGMGIVPSTMVDVPVGGKVIWKNDDPLKPHGIKAIDVATAAFFGTTESIEIPYGKTYEVTFDKVGLYDYTTTFQPQTIGKIRVTA